MRRDGNKGRSLFPLTPAGLGWDKAAPLGSAAAATFASWVRSDGDSPVTPRGAVPERRCWNCMVEALGVMGEIECVITHCVDRLDTQRSISVCGNATRCSTQSSIAAFVAFDHNAIDMIAGCCVIPLSTCWRFDHTIIDCSVRVYPAQLWRHRRIANICCMLRWCPLPCVLRFRLTPQERPCDRGESVGTHHLQRVIVLCVLRCGWVQCQLR